MELLNYDIQEFIQFEIKTESDGVILYRVETATMDWERLWDNGWDEVTFDVELNELEKIYKEWKLNNT